MSVEASVVIPTRNRRELLAEAVRSALSQEDVELEVIVVDDASTDDTVRFLESLDDPRVRPLRQEGRGGVSAARNRGIEAARGEWIAFLDDDDRWLPRRLRTTIDQGREANADFVLGAVVVVSPDRRPLKIAYPPPPERLATEMRRSSLVFGPSAVVARADLLERTGGFDTNLSYLADWELWVRFVAAGRPALCLQPLVEYLRHPGSMLHAPDIDVAQEFEHMRRKHPEVEFEPFLLSRWFAGRFREEGRRFRASMHYLREAITYNEAGSLLRAGVVVFGEGPMRIGSRIRRRLLRAGLARVRTHEDLEVRQSRERSSRL